MPGAGFQKLAKKSIKKILGTLPRTRSGTGWYIANNQIDEVATNIVNRCFSFKEVKEMLEAQRRKLVGALIAAERRSLSKQDTIDEFLGALDD
jgi:hypothetical protein